jgi:hypothetical protein
MRTTAKAFLSVLFGAAGMSCGSDGLTFPELPSALLAEFCVRGTASAGQTVSGSVTDSDCDSADVDPNNEGYYELWRVRVGSSGSVTFDADSPFDNYLTVLRLDSYTQTTADLTIVGENDDRASGNLNALVTVTLQPDTDYFVAIAGYDYSETGSYTVDIR